MTDVPPLRFVWDGEALLPKSQRLADRYLVVGQDYLMVEHHERSIATHNHEFAWLAEAWKNLPERYRDHFPTAEHLRKRALIDAGFFNQMEVDAGTHAAALRVAAAFRAMDEYRVAVVEGPLVFIRTAKSQSRRAMNKAEFQASKTALMEVVAAMVGVTPDELVQNTARAA